MVAPPARGVQTIQYQVVTLLTTNGQAPFVTVFMYLGEAKNQQEKDDLADLRSMATMSLSDSHGLLLEAIEKAYENRVPVGGVAVE